MKTIASVLVAAVFAWLPVSADAAAVHHDEPTSQLRNIDWD